MNVDKIAPATIAPMNSIGSIAGGQGGGGLTAWGTSTVPFSDLLGQAMRDLAETQSTSMDDAYGLITGSGADLHTVMIRSAMETTAVETAVELTSRVVSAYKEIMQMQV